MITITTSVYYPLWIGTGNYTYTQVSNGSVTGFSGISFSVSGNTNTLAVKDISLSSHFIVNGLDNLTISVEGDNTLTRSDSCTTIRSFNSQAPLTFKKATDAACSLTLGNSTVIKGFVSVTFGDATGAINTITTVPATYNTTLQKYVDATDNSTAIAVLDLTTKTTYQVWMRGEQITEDNKTGNGKWALDDNNKLTLSNFPSTGGTYYGHAIISNLPSLTVDLTSDQNYSRCSGYAFYSINSDATLSIMSSNSAGKFDATESCTSGTYSLSYGFKKVEFDEHVSHSETAKKILPRATMLF